jgi:hypothetical protein
MTIKSKFEPWEDKRLLEVVQMHGPTDWRLISTYLPGRNARQCRERWTNYVNPNLLNSQWTEAEDEILLKTYREIGPKWFEIASYLPGRARNNVKNRYFALQRREAFQTENRAEFPPDTSIIPSVQMHQSVSQTDQISDLVGWSEFANDQELFDWDPETNPEFSFYF